MDATTSSSQLPNSITTQPEDNPSNEQEDANQPKSDSAKTYNAGNTTPEHGLSENDDSNSKLNALTLQLLQSSSDDESIVDFNFTHDGVAYRTKNSFKHIKMLNLSESEDSKPDFKLDPKTDPEIDFQKQMERYKSFLDSLPKEAANLNHFPLPAQELPSISSDSSSENNDEDDDAKANDDDDDDDDDDVDIAHGSSGSTQIKANSSSQKKKYVAIKTEVRLPKFFGQNVQHEHNSNGERIYCNTAEYRSNMAHQKLRLVTCKDYIRYYKFNYATDSIRFQRR